MLTQKLCLIYSLNVVDWVCTVTLLRTGTFFEANPLMRLVIGDLSLGFLVKCLFPIGILMIVWRLYRAFETPDLALLDKAVSFVLTLYMALGVVHIVNLFVWNYAL